MVWVVSKMRVELSFNLEMAVGIYVPDAPKSPLV